MQFIHDKVRLNASITQSMRFFLIGREIDKWLGKAVAAENKIGGIYHLELEHEDHKWSSETTILEKDFERLFKFEFVTPKGILTLVEVFFMPCTSKTEYCTEIHLMHKGVSSEEEAFIQSFWHDKLNLLRQIFNKDWIIEDRDLVLSVLKGGY